MPARKLLKQDASRTAFPTPDHAGFIMAGRADMKQFNRNTGTRWHGRHGTAQITPALIAQLWFTLVLIALIMLLAAAANPQTITGGGGWPRTIQSDGIRIDVYQPQAESWENGKLEDRIAMAVTEKATGQTVYGTAWTSARTTVDQDTRMVTLYDVVVKKAVFPSAGAKESALVASATEALQQWDVSIALDRLLADIAITQNQGAATGDTLGSTPPKIFVRANPAVLILMDGQPVLEKVPGSGFMRVVNTPAMMVLDTGSSRYFLRGDGYWMTAAALSGPWTKAVAAPASLASLLEPGEESAARVKDGAIAPEVIVSTEPAELIQTDGEPQFLAIDGTRLLYVTNTDSDLFMDMPQQRYYVLLSGRWFSAASLEGPWEFVAGASLPLDFSRIPAGHPKSAILASIPGTPEARDAIVAAQVPQTATVDRKKTQFTATYDGEPKFKSIAGTEMAYAVNSPNDIIRARGKYYAVSNGVWFVAEGPLGPWSVCDFVPPEIYSIPPTVPVYHVKYVYVYDATPDWVYVGYTPGYFGAFIWDGVVVYGTGFYYPYWYSSFYFGWPWTWGFGFHYAYWGGGFYWRPWYPRPWYWHHWRSPLPPPAHWSRVLYNRSVERTANQVSLRGATVYDRWRSPGVISRRPVPLRAPGRIGTRPQITTRTPSAPRQDLYSDRSGQVYSHRADGWYRREGRTWQRIQPQVPGQRRPQTQVPQQRQPQMPAERQSQAPGRGQVQPPVTGAPRRSQPPAMPTPRAGQPQMQRPEPRTPSVGQPRFGELERGRQARIQGQNRVNQYRTMPPPARTTSPPPRMSAPSPRMSAPQPRMSAPPRMSVPRGGVRR